MLLYICPVSEEQVDIFLVKYLSCSRSSINVLSSHQSLRLVSKQAQNFQDW